MPLGNLIEAVHSLYESSRQSINNLPEVELSDDSCRNLSDLLRLFYPNGAVCKKHYFQVKTDRQLWIVCPNQYLSLILLAQNCAAVVKNYFDFLDEHIRNDPNMMPLVERLQQHFEDDTKKFDNATEEKLDAVDGWLVQNGCTVYIAHCEESPNDRHSLCLFLAGFGVKSFWDRRGLRPTNDLFKSYILSIMPFQNESTGVVGHLVYDLVSGTGYYERLSSIVNQNPMGTLVSSPLQLILFGAPGTGKSFKIDDSENGYGLEDVDEKFKFRTTFHPDYDYAQFVGAYKPLKTSAAPILNKDELLRELRLFLAEERPNPVHKFAARYFNSLKRLTTEEKRALFNEAEVPDSVQNAEVPKATSIASFLERVNKPASITYSFVPQVFAKAYVKAWVEYLKATTRNPAVAWENVYLVIEEINRGSCAQIFGDIFQLLDRDEGHSAYSIDVDADFAAYIKEQLSKIMNADNADVNYWEEYQKVIQEWSSENGQGDNEVCDDFCKIALPPNLNILATMNTSDQSLFPMDSAFKRRFDWEYVPINDKHLEAHFAIEVGDNRYDWRDFLTKVNKNIYDVTKSEDKQLGEFFIKPQNGNSIKFDEFRSKVLFYLWDSIYKDEEGNEKAETVFHFKIAEGSDDTMTFQKLFDKENGINNVKMILDRLNIKEYNQNEDVPANNAEQDLNQGDDEMNVLEEDANEHAEG